MVSKYMFSQVRMLISEGQSDRAIARSLGLDRKTVGKYRKMNCPPFYAPRVRATKVDPFLGFEDTLAGFLQRAPNLTALEVEVLLKEQGYTGSLRTIERRLAKIKRVTKERFFEQDYEPGEQAQFDFKESVSLPFVSGDRVVNLHFGTLPYSDFFHITAYAFKNYEAFISGVHSFFSAAGGLTKNIRFDNLSPCVTKVLKGSERRYTQSFQAATQYYGFGLLPCRPGKGSDKGDVEREIRTQILRIENAVQLSGEKFQDFAHLNQWLAVHCEKWRSEKTKTLWREEREKFLPLPPASENILAKVEMVLATSYGTVRIAKSSYSVPDSAIGKTVRVVCGAYDVKIYAAGDGKLIATHPRQSDCANSILLEHILPSLIRKPQAMMRWAHKDLLFPEPIFKKYFDYLTKKFPDGREREYLRVINLIHYATLADIAVALELVITEDSPDHPFEAIKQLVLTPGHRQSVRRPESITRQPPLAPILKLYDQLIPKPFTAFKEAL